MDSWSRASGQVLTFPKTDWHYEVLPMISYLNESDHHDCNNTDDISKTKPILDFIDEKLDCMSLKRNHICATYFESADQTDQNPLLLAIFTCVQSDVEYKAKFETIEYFLEEYLKESKEELQKHLHENFTKEGLKAESILEPHIWLYFQEQETNLM